MEIALIFVLGANPNPNDPLFDKRFIIGGVCVIGVILFSSLIVIGLHDTPLAASEITLNFTHIKTGTLQRVHLDLADKYYASDNYRISDGQMFYLFLDGHILESGPFNYLEGKEKNSGLTRTPLASASQVTEYFAKKQKKKDFIHFLISVCVCIPVAFFFRKTLVTKINQLISKRTA